MNEIPNPIIVGYTTTVRNPETARNHLQVHPPANLKKAESIQAWRDDTDKQRAAWAQIEQYLPWTKLTGAAASVVALDVRAGKFFDSGTEECRAPGTAFVMWLLHSYEFPEVPGGDYPVLFYGLNPKPLLRLAGQTANRNGVQVPLGLWYSATDSHCLDPLQMILEADVKKLYPLAKVCAEAPFGPIPLPADYRQHKSALDDLRLATELCVRYGLLPRTYTVALRKLVKQTPEYGFKPPEAAAEEVPPEDADVASAEEEEVEEEDGAEETPPEPPPAAIKKKGAKGTKKKRPASSKR